MNKFWSHFVVLLPPPPLGINVLHRAGKQRRNQINEDYFLLWIYESLERPGREQNTRLEGQGVFCQSGGQLQL